MPPFLDQLKVVQVGDGVYASFKMDAPQFPYWCFEFWCVFLDMLLEICYLKRNALKLLSNYFLTHFQCIKDVFSQENWMSETNFGRHGGKSVFCKKLLDFWDMKIVYTTSNNVLDNEYKALWNSLGTSFIVKKMEEQEPWEMKQYLTRIMNLAQHLDWSRRSSEFCKEFSIGIREWCWEQYNQVLVASKIY